MTSDLQEQEDTQDGQIPGLGILDILLHESSQIYQDAVAEATSGGHRLAATVTMFSGGNDSIIASHLFRDRADYAGMCNTGIGIEKTRQFVRDTCQQWGLPLIEKHPRPGRTYRDMVLGKMISTRGKSKGKPVTVGFPNQFTHGVMYHWLKERQMKDIRADLVTGPNDRVIFISGVRKPESAKRKRTAQAVHRDGSIVWCSPLINWAKVDLNAYRRRFPGVPSNEVADCLHMSGECLCGSNAKAGELDEVGFWFPEVAAEIRALEEEARSLGIERCTWGGGSGSPCAGICNL
jgi:3'-phosphoadenosine 5'-phosphosulfate sulfotransferase (PAPS reductase)/FAD synthetase